MGLLWDKMGVVYQKPGNAERENNCRSPSPQGLAYSQGGACEYLAKEAGGGPEAEEAAVDDAAKAEV